MELTLPYDYEMENAVLGSVISNVEKFDDVEKYFINIEVLYQTKAQLLWKRIMQMKKGMPLMCVGIAPQRQG